MPTQINKTKVPLISRGQCVNWYTKITTFHGAIFPEAGRFFVGISPTPGRSKVSFYGVYIYNLGEVRIFPNDTANGLNTIDVLNALKTEFPNHPMTLIWDGAPYHRSQIVKDAAATLGIKIEPLPSYSPDFLPVEHLWQWLRQDITYHTCYERPSDLIEQVSAFQQQINASPNTVADRLWVTTHLKPDEEKLRVST
jgi:transposase